MVQPLGISVIVCCLMITTYPLIVPSNLSAVLNNPEIKTLKESLAVKVTDDGFCALFSQLSVPVQVFRKYFC